jgi:branched-chain amino acid transport system substrate-binding protein
LPTVTGQARPRIWRNTLRPIRFATITLLTSAVVATSLVGCSSGDDPETGGEIVIGADLELSGTAATVGQAYQRALELRVEQLNASGSLGARKIRLLVKDNRSDPNESARNIGDLTGNPDVSAVIMGSCNECATAAAKTLNDQRMPAVALAAASTVASPVVERRYLFKMAPNAADNAAALAVELARKKVKKVALLHTDDAYGREGQAALVRELGKGKIKISKTTEVKATDPDITAGVDALTSDKPGALIVWTTPEQAMLTARAARDASYKGALFFDAVAAGELFMAGAEAASAENTTLVFTQTMAIDDVIATTPAKAARKQWFREYTARYGGYHGRSSFAADAVTLITDAVVRATDDSGQIDRNQVRDILETSQLDGLSGPIRMTPDNHSGLMPQALTMLVARDGRWRLAS